MSHHKKARRQRGFTLIETLTAIIILTVGLVGLAALMGKMISSGANSRYMSQAAMLASEKLENLERYPPNDPNVAVTSGTVAGSLTADTTASVTSNGMTESVDYFDSILVSATGGAVSETMSGSSGFTTVTHTPNGIMTSTTTSSAPAPSADSLTFDRRWTIEKDVPVAGVRRITVLVTLTNPVLVKTVTFQMSTVRP